MEHDSVDPAQPGEVDLAERTADSQFRYAQVGRIVNGFTHDINNFMGAAQAYAELVLMDRELSPENRRMLAEVVNSTVKCSQIVNAISTIARPPERDIINIVDVPDVLTDLEMLFTYTCRAARVRFIVERPGELPSILASSAKLTLALVYIVWDTLDRMGSAKAGDEVRSLHLTCKMDETHLTFVIAHSGAPFYEEQTTTWRGAGNGLSEAAKIARLHQGDLVYRPDEGYVLRLSRQLAPNLAMK